MFKIVIYGQRRFRQSQSEVYSGSTIEERDWCDCITYNEKEEIISKKRFFGPCCEQMAHNSGISKFGVFETTIMSGTFWNV